MSDPESPTSVLRIIAQAVQRVVELVPLPLNQRPAFPAITAPSSGTVITASQAAPTSLAVQVTSNRSDQAHVVDLLDADTFAVLDGPVNVAFIGNNGTATISIPTMTAAGPTTVMLQCRVPSSVAGNSHRILIDIQAPALPPAPTVTLSATANGAALPSGVYPRTTPGLSNIQVTVATPTGTPPFTYTFTVAQGTGIPNIISSPNPTLPVDLIPAGTTFPTAAFISCFVTDAHGLNSPSIALSYVIT